MLIRAILIAVIYLATRRMCFVCHVYSCWWCGVIEERKAEPQTVRVCQCRLTPTLAAGVAAAALVRSIAHSERLFEMHLPTPVRTPSTFTCIMGTPIHYPNTVTNTSRFRWIWNRTTGAGRQPPWYKLGACRIFNLNKWTWDTDTECLRLVGTRAYATVGLGRGMARDANGRRRRLRRGTGPRVSGARMRESASAQYPSRK